MVVDPIAPKIGNKAIRGQLAATGLTKRRGEGWGRGRKPVDRGGGWGLTRAVVALRPSGSAVGW